MRRRGFLKATAVAGAAWITGCASPGGPSTSSTRLQAVGAEPVADLNGATTGPVVLSTWKPGLAVSQRGLAVLDEGGSPLDAVEQGARVSEADASNRSVGFGGLPNRDGVVQLDASIMVGDSLDCGSVAAMQDIKHPISVARLVMERSPHAMLVGQGATEFATEHGHPVENLLTPASERAWKKWKESPEGRAALPPANEGRATPEHHDTMGLVARAADGKMAAACTTSGMSWKLPGRVGDSPIVGAGMYVDDEAGGAAATGLGEEVIKVCGCYQIVEFMRQGVDPNEAIRRVLERIVRRNPRNAKELFGFVAVRRDGAIGLGSTKKAFVAGLARPSGLVLVQSPVLEG